jgi:hypothetical protein
MMKPTTSTSAAWIRETQRRRPDQRRRQHDDRRDRLDDGADQQDEADQQHVNSSGESA